MRCAIHAPVLALLLATGTLGAQEAQPRPGGGLFFDVLPATKAGRLLVPLRPLFEWVGARVEYQAGAIRAYETASAIPVVELTVGQPRALLAGRPYELDVAPEVISGRTFVPLRFVAESFGVWVDAVGRVVNLSVPQLGLQAQMAVAPAPGSHHDKIWHALAFWYNLPGAPPLTAGETPHWDLFSRERQAELLGELGPEAPPLIEAHARARQVQGIRILFDAVDEVGGAAAVAVMVRYTDGGVYRDEFAFLLEAEGWRVRRVSSAQEG